MRARLLSLFVFFLLILHSPVAAYANSNADTNSSTINVDSGSVPADGSTTVKIKIQVRDNRGNNLAGDNVALKSTNDPGLTINSSSVGTNSMTASTDSNGNVIFTVKSSNTGTDTFTATDTSDNPPVALGPNGGSVRL